MARSAISIHGRISKFLHARYREEAYNDVLHELTCRLLDVDSDKDDISQFRYLYWLKRVTFNTLRPHFTRQKQDKSVHSLDQLREYDEMNRNPSSDHETSSLQFRELLNKEASKALDILEPRERLAFILRHYAEWEIQNQNPEVMTISKYFNKTPETIRNWLRRAEKKLKEWREEKYERQE